MSKKENPILYQKSVRTFSRMLCLPFESIKKNIYIYVCIHICQLTHQHSVYEVKENNFKTVEFESQN